MAAINKNGRFLLLFSGLAVCAGLVAYNGCSGKTEQKQGVQTMRGLLEGIGEHSQALVFGTEDGPQMIITPELSARVLGVSFDGTNGENLMWVNESILDGSYWSKKPYFWNAGGYRTWLAPEDLFFLDEKKEWFVPVSLDPAPFKLIERNDYNASFEADVNLKTNTGLYYRTTITRRLALLTSPPPEVGALPAGMKYVGIDLVHSLTNRMEDVIGEDIPYVCLWDMLQVYPSGTTLVPLAEGCDPNTAYREYFNPLGDRLVISNNIISVKIDGKYRSKIGVRPEASKSGLGFLRDNGDSTGILFALVFPIDPEGIYVDKPWGTDSDYGDAIELYNDDGAMGGFTEIECHGPAKKLRRGESQSHKVSLYIFGGPLPELKRIGSILLKADLMNAHYF